VAGESDDFVGFEWDEEKSAQCHEQRGFDFAYAARLFESGFIEWEDRRKDWGEPGVVVVGEVEEHVLTGVWTPRGMRRRIVSARPASRKERDKLGDYRQAYEQRNS
jgi:uncharacterized DUF497 family protein